ncbi:nicotinamide-nucleotide adenylyltransferase [Desulfolithobacter dissulfuricans]|uniref:Nicotinamide-nucleotide adenylyltransferase n=1 Tax=Desulfolithobacter dissulfuricans TaxID=2795293 RepID=A0A915U4F1_9BACT|nr:nicotinate-nucleotide adenylyltransferase [Desulfolithobacter dissulfuricans]BCO10787.1 nicotinamide-nucleotide adenylyltransferase [Desulfolithobacter dissulfuricans]
MGKSTVVSTGFIHGRFQVLHNDHLVYLLAGKERCNHLVVGISNPDPTLTRKDEADSARSSLEANPLTYYERYLMVRAALTGAGLRADEYSVVPFPVNFPELYRYYVPMDAVFYLTIYDSWGEKKLTMFTELGLKTEILWRRPREEKGLSSTEIRRRMVAGEKWTHLVPPAVARLAVEFNLGNRLAGAK